MNEKEHFFLSLTNCRKYCGSFFFSGIDNWLCEYILVVFDDFTFVQCPDGEFIDNLQRHELECGLPSM